MRNIFIAIFIAAVLILIGAYAWTRLGLRERVSGNITDTQPLDQNPAATFIPFPTTATIPGLTLASTAPIATGSATPRPSLSPSPTINHSCQFLTAVPANGVAPLTVKLTASGAAVGTNRAYIFDFGEGAPATQTSTSVSHTYQTPGSYTAKLEVRDNQGNKVNLNVENCWRTITVTGKPQATTAGNTNQLPQTGPEAFILVLLAPVIGIGAWLYRRFKLL